MLVIALFTACFSRAKINKKIFTPLLQDLAPLLRMAWRRHSG